jgi:hypothetical protein
MEQDMKWFTIFMKVEWLEFPQNKRQNGKKLISGSPEMLKRDGSDKESVFTI